MCSSTHRSLLTLFPSTWCAAVAAPQRNPRGKPAFAGWAASPRRVTVSAAPAVARPVERNVRRVSAPSVIAGLLLPVVPFGQVDVDLPGTVYVVRRRTWIVVLGSPSASAREAFAVA